MAPAGTSNLRWILVMAGVDTLDCRGLDEANQLPPSISPVPGEVGTIGSPSMESPSQSRSRFLRFCRNQADLHRAPSHLQQRNWRLNQTPHSIMMENSRLTKSTEMQNEPEAVHAQTLSRVRNPDRCDRSHS